MSDLCSMVVYFISDLHLGRTGRLTSKAREQIFIDWLKQISQDAEALYIIGDLFDFWFEYKRVVPKGFVRSLGALAALRDAGLPIYFIVGNHDMWMNTYFETELGIPTTDGLMHVTHYGFQLELGHGDGLGPGDYTYKMLKKFFRSPLCKWAFHRLHPNVGVGIAHAWSGNSREKKPAPDYYLGDKEEWLVQYCLKANSAQPDINYYVFGHRHLPIDFALPHNNARYINIGDWLEHQTYGRLDAQGMQVLSYQHKTPVYSNNGRIVGVE